MVSHLCDAFCSAECDMKATNPEAEAGIYLGSLGIPQIFSIYLFTYLCFSSWTYIFQAVPWKPKAPEHSPGIDETAVSPPSHLHGIPKSPEITNLKTADI